MTANNKQLGSVSNGLAGAAARVLVTIGFLAFATSLLADGKQGNCKASDMLGDFATEPQGTLLLTLPPPLPSGPFVAVGLLHFDGVSQFAGITSSSFGGVILPAFAAAGHYTVTSDCIVSVTEATLGIQFVGYFSKDKNQVVHFEPQSGTITTNILRRQQMRWVNPESGWSSSCGAGNLKDNWVIQDAGSVAGSPVTLFAQNGRFNFDGNGKFQGNTSSSLGGAIVSHTVAGTYSVNSDCTFHASFTDETNTTAHIFGVLYGLGNEFYFDYQDAGTIIAGTGRQAVSFGNGFGH